MNKKVLVIGNNTEDTNVRTEKLAKRSGNKNFGLIEFDTPKDFKYGHYHTSLADVSSGFVMSIAKDFDEVILLDQNEYDSQKILLSTFKLFVNLEQKSNRLGLRTKYKENKNIKVYNDWIQYFQKNKSFCIYPWINYNDQVNEGTGLQLCSRASKKLKEVEDLHDWKTDPDYTRIRRKMLKGELIPEHCKVCYQYESRGLTAYRTHDSLDYIAKLGIETLEDLDKITNPYYYEIRSGNKCNLKCRMCSPNHSHLLRREFKQNPELSLPMQWIRKDYPYSNINDVVNIESLTDKHTVYPTGGEPTVMKEIYEFMRRCIDAGKTDYNLTIPTNANRISGVFWDLASKFSNLHFSVSVDGLGLVNDYIRWNSSWDNIVATCEKIKSEGHQFTWNHVPTIWGIHRTHEFFEFASRAFPFEHLYLQYNRVVLHSAYVSPLIEEVKESMRRTMETSLYYSDGKDCKSGIDSFYEHYQTFKCDPEQLEKFFRWNDLMDNARNIELKDYIPELDACRPY